MEYVAAVRCAVHCGVRPAGKDLVLPQEGLEDRGIEIAAVEYQGLGEVGQDLQCDMALDVSVRPATLHACSIYVRHPYLQHGTLYHDLGRTAECWQYPLQYRDGFVY